MLTAAGINASGPKGMIRAQGLALLFANVVRTWVDDEDGDNAKTLAALDRELGRGQQMVGLIDGLAMVRERGLSGGWRIPPAEAGARAGRGRNRRGLSFPRARPGRYPPPLKQ